MQQVILNCSVFLYDLFNNNDYIVSGFIQDVKISNVRLANVSRNLLIFSWSGDIPYCSTSYGYFIHTNNCGVCANKTKDTTVSCPFVSQGGRELCNFTVQVQACGEATGNNAVSIVVMPTGKLTVYDGLIHYIMHTCYVHGL